MSKVISFAIAILLSVCGGTSVGDYPTQFDTITLTIDNTIEDNATYIPEITLETSVVPYFYGFTEEEKEKYKDLTFYVDRVDAENIKVTVPTDRIDFDCNIDTYVDGYGVDYIYYKGDLPIPVVNIFNTSYEDDIFVEIKINHDKYIILERVYKTVPFNY